MYVCMYVCIPKVFLDARIRSLSHKRSSECERFYQDAWLRHLTAITRLFLTLSWLIGHVKSGSLLWRIALGQHEYFVQVKVIFAVVKQLEQLQRKPWKNLRLQRDSDHCVCVRACVRACVCVIYIIHISFHSLHIAGINWTYHSSSFSLGFLCNCLSCFTTAKITFTCILSPQFI